MSTENYVMNLMRLESSLSSKGEERVELDGNNC